MKRPILLLSLLLVAGTLYFFGKKSKLTPSPEESRSLQSSMKQKQGPSDSTIKHLLEKNQQESSALEHIEAPLLPMVGLPPHLHSENKAREVQSHLSTATEVITNGNTRYRIVSGLRALPKKDYRPADGEIFQSKVGQVIFKSSSEKSIPENSALN